MIELDENHQYKVNGYKCPGVSEILTHFGFNDFNGVPDKYLQPAILFGSVVHKVIEMVENKDTYNFNEDHNKIKRHWEDFKKTIKLEDCLIDIKTNSSSKPTTANLLQLFAYKLLIETSKFKVSKDPKVEQVLYSDVWNFCGKPDYFNANGYVKKLHIVCINMEGFKSFTYYAVKDKRYEDDFKALLKVYQIQKREKII